ncbi:hypothetical protein Poly30_02000 [Planctomycetes bacterium Poly30]|uniref:Uncharacterized protein n=1 Tax=Saltatorellus ferox TaxID=2528018 RepID=A0A518EKT0_9BACT|nr:hypothetical protein Poly30_02000 [Planctomycetes bacterium Poly30]
MEYLSVQGGDGGVGAEFGQGAEAFVSDTEFMGGSGGQCGNCWPCDGFQGLGAIGTGGGQA